MVYGLLLCNLWLKVLVLVTILNILVPVARHRSLYRGHWTTPSPFRQRKAAPTRLSRLRCVNESHQQQIRPLCSVAGI